MRVLEALERGGGPMSLSKIADGSGLQPSKTHRYLVSLLRAGLVSQEPGSGLYNLGPAARRLGIEALRRTDEVSIASAHAASLRDRTGHTIYLAVWSDAGPSLVRWDHGSYPLPVIVRIGSTLPMADSSVGHVALTYLPEAVTRPVLRAQQRHKETSDLPPDRLREIVAEVRSAGLATTHAGVIHGLDNIAAPIFGPGNGLALIIGVAIPARYVNEPLMRRLSSELLTAADAISTDLGCLHSP